MNKVTWYCVRLVPLCHILCVHCHYANFEQSLLDYKFSTISTLKWRKYVGKRIYENHSASTLPDQIAKENVTFVDAWPKRLNDRTSTSNLMMTMEWWEESKSENYGTPSTSREQSVVSNIPPKIWCASVWPRLQMIAARRCRQILVRKTYISERKGSMNGKQTHRLRIINIGSLFIIINHRIDFLFL